MTGRRKKLGRKGKSGNEKQQAHSKEQKSKSRANHYKAEQQAIG